MAKQTLEGQTSTLTLGFGPEEWHRESEDVQVSIRRGGTGPIIVLLNQETIWRLKPSQSSDPKEFTLTDGDSMSLCWTTDEETMIIATGFPFDDDEFINIRSSTLIEHVHTLVSSQLADACRGGQSNF